MSRAMVLFTHLGAVIYPAETSRSSHADFPETGDIHSWVVFLHHLEL